MRRNPPEKRKKERKLFKKRRESTERMAIFNRRYINNLHNNWKIKQEDHLLPNAGTIFDYINKNLSKLEILKDPAKVKEWWQVVADEESIERDIQEAIAILSWVYWQRLEGYEILDVSLSRERLVEDIGCIQQFYNAADALVLEYKECFRSQLPFDIMCVYGLYQQFHTSFRHFIMVPNHTRYEYIPAWISIAHEVAHILIEFLKIGEKNIELLKKSLETDQKNLEKIRNESVDNFLLSWKQIRRKAIDVAETVIRVMEGDSGYWYLNESKGGEKMEHVGTSEHILADIIATLIAGEFYLYSLVFYRFLPSVFLSEEKIMVRKQQVPMSLRLFICLETLKYSGLNDMSLVVDKIEKLWNKLALDHSKLEGIDKEIQELKNEVSKESFRMTVDLIANLIKSIIIEDSLLERRYEELLQEAEERTEEEKKNNFDKSYFNYMRHALGNTLKQILRNPDGFLVGVGPKGNSLEELIKLVRDTLFDPEKLFTTVERYEIIEKMRKGLISGELILKNENYNDKDKLDKEPGYVTPRNILSAYTQIYFENILNPKKKRSQDYVKAFNTTVMSMAWTQHALKCFHDGTI